VKFGTLTLSASGIWRPRSVLAAVAAAALASGHGAAARGVQAYDPLVVPASFEVQTVDLVVRDEARGRDIPVLVYLPASGDPAPVVLFSHGLGGSRTGNAFMGRHWSARGYVAVFLQHPGSDTSVWERLPARQRMAAMQRAASAESFLSRVRDVPAVLDQLARWNVDESHRLRGRFDLSRVGMSGHSFGAVTTQAVSGQTAARGLISYTDVRIKAAIAFSPSSPRLGDPTQTFGRVAIPWMLMTGTNDVSVIGDQTVESRLAVFPALPPGSKYELVLDKAEHSAFTERALPGDTEARNPNHHRVILALSTAFWDAYLKDQAPARTWLDGDGPASVLEAGDRWRRK
jgi:predicted dienelactone hydrolase